MSCKTLGLKNTMHMVSTAHSLYASISKLLWSMVFVTPNLTGCVSIHEDSQHALLVKLSTVDFTSSKDSIVEFTAAGERSEMYQPSEIHEKQEKSDAMITGLQSSAKGGFCFCFNAHCNGFNEQTSPTVKTTQL